MTLDGGGDPNAVFVFQVNGALAMAAGSHVVLTNGARASRVFWQVNGAGAIGANADFAGTLMALDAVAVGDRTWSTAACSLATAPYARRQRVLQRPARGHDRRRCRRDHHRYDADDQRHDRRRGAGGRHRDDQRADAHLDPLRGAWSVTSAILANAVYPVVASVSDGAGNPASATQQLTVDTVLPVVTLDGGPFVTTNDATPTISGTSDVAAGTVVRVAVDSQSLTALVQSVERGT